MKDTKQLYNHMLQCVELLNRICDFAEKDNIGMFVAGLELLDRKLCEAKDFINRDFQYRVKHTAQPNAA